LKSIHTLHFLFNSHQCPHLVYIDKPLLIQLAIPNTRLGNPAIKVLKKLMEKADFKELAEAYYNNTTWKDWQQEKLKSVFEEAAK